MANESTPGWEGFDWIALARARSTVCGQHQFVCERSPMNAESPFDKTERFPSAWEHGDERYVRDTNEWVARCRARVLQLDVV